MKKKKLFVGISAPNSVDLLIGQLRYMKEHNYDVYLLAPADPRVTEYCLREGVPHIPVPIERNISLWKDLRTLFYLIRIFLRERPDIINLGTPKMSLVGMIAGFLTRVPYRIYTCRGLRFDQETGSIKKMLIQLEKITALCSNRVYCISKSVRDLGVSMKIFPLHKTRLIGKGSSNGVDMTLFSPDVVRSERVTALREQYGLHGKVVFGFVGRLVDRKGIKEMYDAFDDVYKKNPKVRLLVVGRPFWDQIRDSGIIKKLEQHPGIIMAGFQVIEAIPYFLSTTDIFFLPTHGEGFGNVFIQAASMGIPVIATDVTGCRDAVNDGFNGVLVPLGNHDKLVAEMNRLVNDEELRTTLGKNGMLWSKNFEPEIIWRGYQALYEETV